MLLSKNVLSLALAASSDSSRSILGGVRIEPDGSGIATDGHILVKFTPSLEYSAEEYPGVAGCDLVGTEPLRPFILDAESCRTIKKAIPKNSWLPILTHTFGLDVAGTNAASQVIVVISDGSSLHTLSLQKVEGDFPDYERVIPKAGLGKVRIGLGVASLKKLVATLEALDVEYFSADIEGEEKPIRIEARPRVNTGDVLAALMPFRLPR